eukprot:GILK01007687.1.p1 GENE.GILK01007687.1~~GILK01007687.1.p1  ORF type:complete len:561 (+),score=52.69 GILK01007687.1:114-1796(+)
MEAGLAWALGVLLTVFGAAFGNFGCNLQKLYQEQEESKASDEQRLSRHYCTLPKWWIGLIIYLVGNGLHVVGLFFAPASVLAPLNSFALVANAFMAPCVNNEKFTRWDFFATVAICSGSVLTTIFPPKSGTNVLASEVEALYTNTGYICYICVVALCLLLLHSVIIWKERELIAALRKSNASTPFLTSTDMLSTTSNVPADSDHTFEIELEHNSPFLDTAAPSPSRNNKSNNKSNNKQQQKQLRPPVSRPHSRSTPELPTPSISLSFSRPAHAMFAGRGYLSPYKLLPLAYGAVGGLWGSQTVLFIKAIDILIAGAFTDEANEFRQPLPYVILAFLLLTAAQQLHWLNVGLRHCDALVVIPMFYVVWTIVSVVGGAVKFHEFNYFSKDQFIAFTVGTVLILVGTYLLALREAQETFVAEDEAKPLTGSDVKGVDALSLPLSSESSYASPAPRMPKTASLTQIQGAGYDEETPTRMVPLSMGLALLSLAPSHLKRHVTAPAHPLRQRSMSANSLDQRATPAAIAPSPSNRFHRDVFASPARRNRPLYTQGLPVLDIPPSSS